MKKRFALAAWCLSCALALTLASCTSQPPATNASEDRSADTSVEDHSSAAPNESSTVSSAPTPYIPHSYNGTETFSNRTLENGENRMGDQDGPAYCVYSKQGYTAVSMELELSKIELNIYRNDNRKRHVNAYIFLGADVYNEDGDWVNCADAGLVYSGKDGWHVFYNLYTCANPETTATWHESGRTLPPDHDYRLSLDVSNRDGRATLSVYDLTRSALADRVTFDLYRAKKDGSNVSFLTNFALDYPEDLCFDTAGNPSTDWIEVTLYNSDQGIYMKNIGVHNCKLYQDDAEFDWTFEHTQNRGIWPDASNTNFDYACTTIRAAIENMEYIIDLDMNRP